MPLHARRAAPTGRAGATVPPSRRDDGRARPRARSRRRPRRASVRGLDQPVEHHDPPAGQRHRVDDRQLDDIDLQPGIIGIDRVASADRQRGEPRLDRRSRCGRNRRPSRRRAVVRRRRERAARRARGCAIPTRSRSTASAANAATDGHSPQRSTIAAVPRPDPGNRVRRCRRARARAGRSASPGGASMQSVAMARAHRSATSSVNAKGPSVRSDVHQRERITVRRQHHFTP